MTEVRIAARVGGYAADKLGEHGKDDPDWSRYDVVVELGTTGTLVGAWPDCGSRAWKGNDWQRVDVVVNGETFALPLYPRHYEVVS